VPGWAAAVERARGDARDPDDLATLQRLMATLDDAHSWAKDTRVTGRLPYALHDDGETVHFWAVPEGTAAWDAGVRPGDRCLAPDTAPWRDRTGSARHARPWNVGYRALQGPVGSVVAMAAIRADGGVARWEELVPPLPWDAPIEPGRLDPRTGYLRIRGWLATPAWRDTLLGALREMDRYERLVVDLRGNVGGALIAAQDARARFLPGRTALGTIRFSTVTGAMDRPHELVAEPPADGPVWTKPVRFLIDPLCYSATEDFLQGLQGLGHVQLVGQRTGGGSGRPRTVRLREHLIATISTALTFDRAGRCIEGNGFAPDIAVPADPCYPDATLDGALRDW
jgi:carboxyl-terminal processing protease